MRDYPPLNFKILNQGGPIANRGHIVSQSDELVLVHIDFKSKWCEIAATGGSNENEGPTIYIEITKQSLYINEEAQSDFTEIEFPDFKEFDIICSEFSRYSLYVTFVKKGIW